MQYLRSLEKFGINLGLGRTKFLLEMLGNPQLKFKSIHVAGTNGKGSTSAMIASILKEAGYKVGLYTSPHLFDYRERIDINGRKISKHEFLKGLRLVKNITKNPRLKSGESFPTLQRGGFRKSQDMQPTVFECLTAVAFWYFAKEKVDYAVVEVGLGGRLDATNVVTPLVSVITNVDYEHTNILGKTLAKIAYEKAGIIKPGIPVVTAEKKREALRVIEEVCRKRGSKLEVVNRKSKAPRLRSGQVESRKPLDFARGKSKVGILIGSHQKINAACAIAALQAAGIKISKRAITTGLKKVRWPARFQVISKKPLTIVDGAHNPAGAKVLRETLQAEFPGKKFSFVVGMQEDKNARGILAELKPVAREIILTRSAHKQSALRIAGMRTVKLRKAFSLTEHTDRVIAGSLYLAADALNYLRGRSKIEHQNGR
jgi:dihydrofolate synthase/folylpolyglutamate synthase